MIKDKLFRLIAPLAALATLAASPAWADNTLGETLQTAHSGNISAVVALVVAVAYLIGFGLVASGLMRLKETADRGDKTFGDGLARLGGGTVLASLPTALGVGVETIFADSADGYASETAGAVTNCLAGTPDPLVCVAKNVALNLVPVFVDVSFGLIALVGIIMVAHAVYTMAMSHSQGQRNLPKGWSARLVIGFIIANLPALISAIESTLGVAGGGTILETGFDNSSSLLSYTPGGGAGVLASYGALIGWLFHIFVMFGIIAVWRGIFMLRAYADGQGQGTLGSGMTHIVGGVFLANAKFTTCLITNTLIGAGAALGFC